jgi:hypothetical protein
MTGETKRLQGSVKSFEAYPTIMEEWKLMGNPVCSSQWVISVANAHRNKVKLTFSQDVSLPDPHKFFNAGLGGNNCRAIDYYKDDEINKPLSKNVYGLLSVTMCHTTSSNLCSIILRFQKLSKTTNLPNHIVSQQEMI